MTVTFAQNSGAVQRCNNTGQIPGGAMWQSMTENTWIFIQPNNCVIMDSYYSGLGNDAHVNFTNLACNSAQASSLSFGAIAINTNITIMCPNIASAMVELKTANCASICYIDFYPSWTIGSIQVGPTLINNPSPQWFVSAPSQFQSATYPAVLQNSTMTQVKINSPNQTVIFSSYGSGGGGGGGFPTNIPQAVNNATNHIVKQIQQALKTPAGLVIFAVIIVSLVLIAGVAFSKVKEEKKRRKRHSSKEYEEYLKAGRR
jgi:hypothetical protein